MKKSTFTLVTISLMISLITSLSSCAGIPRVHGNGNVITETRNVSGFHAIDVGGEF